MAAPTNQIAGDVIDAIRPDLEAFASLWSALRTNYQGTNITKTVARLLHMYQPEDGVLAYERLLRTLYVLLEDFDGDGLRLLVSMVPPPKGVPDEAIKEVFYKATGFVRLNAPIFHRNSNAANLEFETNSLLNGKAAVGSSDPRDQLANPETPRLLSFRNGAGNAADGSTILRAVVKSDTIRKSNKSPKISTRESEIFRGFPPNEITTTQSHARNMTHLCRPSINYAGYSAAQRYVDYHQMQGQSGSSNPSRGIDPSAYSRLKWFETPLLVRKNNYDGSPAYPDLILKTSDNKYIRLPITKVNAPPIGTYTSSYNPSLPSACQSYYQHNQIHMRNNGINDDSSIKHFSTNLASNSETKKVFEDGETLDERTIRIVEASRMNIVDHDYNTIKSDDNIDDKENFASGNIGSPTNATVEKFRDAVISRQRAIQEDIYRMDVVRCDQEIVPTPTEEFKTVDVESLTLTEELKKGVRSFLKRAEDGKSLELPAFPRTRALEKTLNFSPALLKSSSRVWKVERLTEYPGCWNQSLDSWKTKESASSCSPDKKISSTKGSMLGDSSANSRGSRGKMGKFSNATKSERISQDDSNRLEISSSQSFKRDSSFGIGQSVDLSGREASPATEPDSKAIDAFHRAKSMAELVNYRKQYYDALLSIQRAKVAVANSLAISSSQTSTNYNPRVFQYLQHQHQILHQQQQQLLMGSQHPATRSAIVQPGYTNIRSAAGMWVRPSDWKYPPGGQYTFPRQLSCSSQEPMDMPKDSSLAEVLRRSSHNLHRSSQRPPVKRRKLEDIVGKLKKSED